MVATALSAMEGQEGTTDIIDCSMDEVLGRQEVEPAVEIVVDAPSKANLIVIETMAKQQDVNL